MLVETTRHVLPVLQRSQSLQKNDVSAAARKRAINAFRDDTSFSSVLLVAARALFGNQCLVWEPESFWTAFAVEYDLDVPTLNRAKFLAASTLVQTPRFYSDANVFEKTCLTFCDTMPIPGAINEASPAQMAWGVLEAEMLMQAEGTTPEFDYEPKRYAATSMARDGLVLAPGLLVFSQDELNKQIRSSVEDTIRAVHQTWERISKDSEDLRDYEYSNTAVDVQLAKLASVELYVRGRAARYGAELAALL